VTFPFGPRQRRSLLPFALATALLATSLWVPVGQARSVRTLTIGEFMTGLACVESGGRFEAVNKVTGALGKYQIMPRNWRSWSGIYLGNRWAEPTPRNQEYVARQRILALWNLHGNWRLVAHWWLTGNADRDESTWSRQSTHYVDVVMAIGIRAQLNDYRRPVPARCYPRQFADPKVRKSPRERVNVTGARVHVRMSPGYKSRAVGTVSRGQRVTVLARGKDPYGQPWLYVGLPNGRTGWIASWLTKSP